MCLCASWALAFQVTHLWFLRTGSSKAWAWALACQLGLEASLGLDLLGVCPHALLLLGGHPGLSDLHCRPGTLWMEVERGDPCPVFPLLPWSLGGRKEAGGLWPFPPPSWLLTAEVLSQPSLLEAGGGSEALGSFSFPLLPRDGGIHASGRAQSPSVGRALTRQADPERGLERGLRTRARLWCISRGTPASQP